MGNHWVWLVFLLVIALIIFGPNRLPELGAALGRGLREFRKASEELREEVSKSVTSRPSDEAPSAPPSPPEQPGPTA